MSTFWARWPELVEFVALAYMFVMGLTVGFGLGGICERRINEWMYKKWPGMRKKV